ncbi:hypothetical protein QQ045_019030 [Rhodiola kirilowii]
MVASGVLTVILKLGFFVGVQIVCGLVQSIGWPPHVVADRGELYPTEQLCEDLIREILIKLHVETLINFKQVSKTWMYIISSHHLAKTHYYYHSVAKSQSPGNKNPKSFFLLRDTARQGRQGTFITSISVTPDQLECTVHEHKYLHYLEGYCSLLPPPLFSIGLGLYCIHKSFTPKVALWNPGTREIKVLPPTPLCHSQIDYDYIVFGHAEYKDDMLFYKVGVLSYKRLSFKLETLELYDSSSNSWKVLACDDILYCRMTLQDGINLNGTLHLLSRLDSKHIHIITFDYSSEVFGRMEVPYPLQITGRYVLRRPFISLYDDKFLCLAAMWKVQDVINYHGFIDVWVMREYGVKESWSKEYTTGPLRHTVLKYSKSIGGIFLNAYDKGTGIGLYNCASSAVTSLPVISDNWGLVNTYVFEHMESLVSINGTPDETRTQKCISNKGHNSHQEHPASNRVVLFISAIKKCFSKLYTSRRRS